MKTLTLTRPLIFLDLETTGVSIEKDQIIEIGMWKLFPSGEKKAPVTFLQRIRPSCPMHPQASEVLGITDADLVSFPSFGTIAQEVANFIQGSDVAGFNSDRFDMPLLVEELLRHHAQFDFSDVRTVDVMKIYHHHHRRNLEAAYMLYCKKELLNMHTAEADLRATAEILVAQINQHDLGPDIFKWNNRGDSIDFAGKIVAINGQACFNFGKYKGKEVALVAKSDPSYISWIASGEFPQYTKKVLVDILSNKVPF